ncbi:MAG: DNA methyltransferase [Hyphomonadaceae bacterium]|nr:DNA methyltransferase [Hyphomonadaceae bacterium]
MTSHIRDLQVETIAVSTLKPYPRNARTHSKKQIRQIADSIQEFGWTSPILIDDLGGVIAGHGRLEAAKLLGLVGVPAIRLSHMTEAQKRAYVIADNKLAENAGWDRGVLAIEIQGLIEIDPLFDIEMTGFVMGEIDVLIGEQAVEADREAADRQPEIDPDRPVITRPGDLWMLGRHRLLCGDATKSESFARLLDGEKAQMVFTDPPYNVRIDGHVCGLGSVKHDEFAMACGEMSEAEFTAFLKTTMANLAAASAEGAIHYICMDWRHMLELLSAGRQVYAELKNICVWNKTNGGMGSLYRSKHELVAVFKNGNAPHINNVELGRNGRYRTNVWDYEGVNTFGKERDALSIHPTVKPVQLIEDAILDCSDRGGIVLDAFCGSGSTLIAAERAGRRGFGLELEPKYVDATLRRFRDLTGEEPVRVGDGMPFNLLE